MADVRRGGNFFSSFWVAIIMWRGRRCKVVEKKASWWNAGGFIAHHAVPLIAKGRRINNCPD
jgi:hypothetical protein